MFRKICLGLLAVVLVFSARSETIFSTNSVWKYFKGFSEASSPDTTAWRNIGFNDSSWLVGQAPFYYENDPGSGNPTAYTGNTDLTDMDGGYTCIFMRQTFVLTNLSQIAQLNLTALSDDGFIAWINGVEVARFNMPAGNVPYNGSSSPALAEPVPLQQDALTNPQNYLVTGTNVMAIQAFNSSLSASSDFLIWATLATSATATWGNVGISEFMATNLSTVQDEDGDASPWIEIFNPTTSDVNLNGWFLTDDPNNLTLWKFPNVTIPDLDDANGSDNYIVVFASGKNRTSNTNELHTNFRLPVNGGYLALVDANTNIVSVFSNYPAQQVDVSYGRDVVNPNIVGYFPNPTPGNPNSTAGANFAPAVTFSQTGGTFVNSFNLQLSTTNANAVIYYTLDGSAPTEDSAVYAAPIPITGSVQVRARAFDDADGLMPGDLHSESYIQLDAGLINTNSDLPAVIIYNFGAGSVPQDSDQFANVSIYEPSNGLTYLTNAATLTARAAIHVHGSSSADISKQAFSVGFQDDLGNDENYSPLEMPSESSFILYAPDNFEPVLIHNPLIYQLSNEVGRYASRTKFCEVYLNTAGGKVTAANYNGIYVLEEKIKWDKNRVNVTKIHSVDNLNPQDNLQPNVTGGYLMKIDRLGDGETGFNSAGQTIVYNYPKESEIKTPQRAPQQQYLQNYMNAFGTALNGASYTNPTNGYRAYIDEPSWIDHHILNVMAFNVDALRLSAYFYKDRTNVLVFGPIWDFDRSQGSTDGRDFSPFYWRAPIPDYGTDYFHYTWWGRMFTDIDFWQAWIDRYEDLRETTLSTNHIYADIDALVAQVQREEPREAARWPQYTAPRSGTVSVSGYSYNFPGTYQGEVNFLKKWYADRLHFMDTNFLAKPVFSDTNGAITPGFTLSLTADAGATIYYTTNGTDPRLSGGGVSADAQIYSSPVALSTNVTVMARAYNASHHNLTGANNPPLSSPWSGLASESFVEAVAPVITQSPADLEAYVGQSPVFTVQADGVPAPTYQWQFDGTNLVGATNAQLTLSITQTNQAGTYSIVASNLAGSVTNSFVLTITPKPNLVITEVMSSEAKKGTGVTISTSDWWELSNLGNFAVNLQGYRFDDDHDSFADAQTITNDVTIAPGESIVLVEDMTPADFITWWGATNLPAHLQIITYPSIGFSSDGDAIYLWNAAATSMTDTVASVTFGAATKGVSFGYDPASQTFGGLSVAGQNGAFVAPVNGDIGSPGTILNLPRFTELNFDGNSFNLGFVTEPNLNYTVEYKNDLADPVWQTLTNFTAASTLSVINDPTAMTNATRFYRVVVMPRN
ncbi:MAG TPA: CotH kinase family protein [Verrucomicrobiae bacterium]|nr:CotH kinase family protein [Verrucomicrobiae bacterium]